jgi:hypothetical protein
MSDTVLLDLFIQDFITTNRIANTHISWPDLVNRRFVDDKITKVFSFKSNGAECFAVAQQIVLPDTDWLRIELNPPRIPSVDHRFDCLRMTHSTTHTGFSVSVDESEKSTILVKLTTRHYGLINIVFVIRTSPEPQTNPFLL